MTYDTLATVNATQDVSELFIYVNKITDGLAMPLVLLGFFLVVLIGGAFAQMRFRGSVRIDFAFAVASFASFGLAVLMMTKDGLLNPLYVFVTLGLSVLGVLWLYNTQES